MGVFPLIWSGELRDWRIRSEVEERLVLAVVHLRNQDRTADRSAKRVGVADGSIPADLVRGVEGLAHPIGSRRTSCSCRCTPSESGSDRRSKRQTCWRRRWEYSR